MFENSEKILILMLVMVQFSPMAFIIILIALLSKKRLETARTILDKKSKSDVPSEFDLFRKELNFGLSEMYYWIEKFPDDSMIVLNYAEISSVIHEFTLKMKNSVSDLWSIIDSMSKR